MKWTSEQLDAINKSGSNIIVSAGAGSGKTAVLTERVITKLKNGVSVNQLLILTFTNNAAKEMKERIKKEIIKIPELKNELNFIDSADITTFDAYVLSLVKKYYYLLNIEKDLSIIDEGVISIQKENILNDIFENKYGDSLFDNFVTTFGIKNDDGVKRLILSLDLKCDLLPNKEEFLDTYIDKFYTEDNALNLFSEYEKLILRTKDNIRYCLDKIESDVPSEYFITLENSLINLIESTTYTSIKNNLNVDSPNLPSGSSDLSKYYKAQIKKTLDELNILLYDDKDTLIKELLSTKENVAIIIDILKELNIKINEYKKENNLYEFNDISKLGIKLLKENKEVVDELKNKYNEIMVDEYQDTSDIQELFISLIENNNVYMVGDIKQSIYKFRNANIEIFKNKYDHYKNNKNGIKIDLNKNFRSRKETIEGINLIFKYIMDDYIGNADYALEHQMIHGNLDYKDNNQNNNISILNYKINKNMSKDENEAFIIGIDILNKVKNKYQVTKDKELRPCTFEDFTILIDRTTSFDIYKKVFDYLKIPINVHSDENILHNDETYLIRNIIDFIIKIKNKDYDYKFNYLSIGRSYLYNISDDILYEDITQNKIKESEIYLKCKSISKDIDNMSNSELIYTIIEEFNFYENMIKEGDILNRCIVLDNIIKEAKELNKTNITTTNITNYFDTLIESKKAIKKPATTSSLNAVTLTNIHKSKGLQYNICYYSGLSKRFNVNDSFDKFIYDEKYGFIIPSFNGSYKNTFVYDLFKEKYFTEEISEQVRLFYVALTRCQEKMIILTNIDESKLIGSNNNRIVDYLTRINYRSFQDILSSIYYHLSRYITNIEVPDFDYKTNKISKEEIPSIENKINVNEINIPKEKLETKTFSKKEIKLLTPLEKDMIDKGNHLHYILESIDFINPDYSKLSNEEKDLVKSFLNSDILKDIEKAKIYKEFEFINTQNSKYERGIIDLMLEFKDHIKIIDYKLKNITDEAYNKQLKGYKEYIENKYNKNTEIYLYSILDKTFEKID